MTEYELGRRDFACQLLEQVRKLYGNQKVRKALRLIIKDDELRNWLIRALKDTRHDDVIIGAPYPGEQIFGFAKVEVLVDEPIWMGSQPE